MEADATNAKLKFDTAAQPTAELTRNIERCAGEYMLKARIVVSGIADESRYRQAVKLMSTAIDLVSGRLPEEHWQNTCSTMPYCLQIQVNKQKPSKRGNDYRAYTNVYIAKLLRSMPTVTPAY